MRIQPEQLFDEMRQAIEAKKLANKTDMIEDCFWTASKYWETLKKNIDQSFFEYEGKEINFFRNVKPKFTSQIQFYTMLSEVMLFVPTDEELQSLYWKEETKRYGRFCEKHRKFVDYYESKSVYLDSIYFVRAGPDWKPENPLVPFDSDRKICSTHDHLVRGLLAHKMYFDFVKDKLEQMKTE